VCFHQLGGNVAAHDDLMATAVGQTGLDDFGDDSFREGLEILVRALHGEADLNAAGEAVIYPRLVGHLAQRLQVEDWYRRHPEIDAVPIVAPLFGIGLPRTGSTALSFVLAQDPDIRYLRQWESLQPCPPPATVKGLDPRIAAAMGHSSGTRSHTPSDVNGPMECLDLMALDFKTQIYLAFAKIPSYADWLLDADLTSTYVYERRVLKLLQWQEPVKPWRLKTPAHSLFLPYLDQAFPDARFVMTHRDPTDVILSVADVYADIAGVLTDHLDRGYLAQLNVEHWSVAMERVLAFRDGGAGDRFYDIDFRAMQSDPIGQIRGLYDWLGQGVSGTFETRMREWWTANSQDREPSSHPDASRYGLDLDRVRPRFAAYTERARSWTAAPSSLSSRGS
jgi:Sulfotransferase family